MQALFYGLQSVNEWCACRYALCVEIDGKLLKTLGENIRRERVGHGLTQEKLSEMSGMDITNLQRIEAGKYNTKILTLIRIREALDVDWDVLIPDS